MLPYGIVGAYTVCIVYTKSRMQEAKRLPYQGGRDALFAQNFAQISLTVLILYVIL